MQIEGLAIQIAPMTLPSIAMKFPKKHLFLMKMLDFWELAIFYDEEEEEREEKRRDWLAYNNFFIKKSIIV